MILLQASQPPPGTPWWAVVGVPVVIAIIGAATSVLVARAQRKSPEDVEARLRKLEEEEPAELAKVRDVAATAVESAERVAGDLRRHVEDENRRRRVAREIGQERDAKLAAKVDDLTTKVATVATQVELILDGRVDTGGGSRRGR